MAVYAISNQNSTAYTGATPPFYNIMHVTAPLGDLTSLNTVAGAIKTFYGARPDIWASGTVWTIAYKVVQVDGTPPVQVAVTPQSSTAGTGTGQLTPQLALVVGFKSVVANRHGRGRMYLGPLANQSANSATGQPASGVATGVQTAANAMITSINAVAGCQLVIFNRVTKVTIPITTAVVQSTFFTQRRRAA